MLARLKAAVLRVVRNASVHSVARHALLTAGGIFVSALTVGGLHAITFAVVAAAGAAALRVVWLAVAAKLNKAVPEAVPVENAVAPVVKAEVAKVEAAAGVPDVNAPSTPIS
jgi:hypothetical protein